MGIDSSGVELQDGGAPSEAGVNPPERPDHDGAPPSFDRLLTFARFDNARDKSAKPETKPWSAWAAELSRHEVRHNKDGACVVLGSILAGETHKNDAVVVLEAIGLDIENCTDAQLGRALVALKDFAFVAYSTHKNSTEAANPDPALRVRARIVLPWSRQVQPVEHEELWAALNAMTGAIADVKTKNIGRLFYLPSTESLDTAFAIVNEGRPLDPEDVRAFIRDQAGSDYFPEDREPLKQELVIDGRKRIRTALRKMHAGETIDRGINLKPVADAILGGVSFAEAGERHDAILAMTMWLATRMKNRPPVEAVIEVFAPSLAVMAASDPKCPGPSEVETAWNGAVAKVDAWRAEQEETAQVEREAEAQAHQLQAGGAFEKYTEEELKQIAGVAGIPCEGSSAILAMQRRWIIQAGDSAFYILAYDGGYRGPYGVTTARTAAVELLARAPVMLNEPTRNGMRRRTISELAEDYGLVATEIVVDMTIERTWLDEKTRRIYEAGRPLRAMVPRYDAQIDQWLRLISGAQYDKICDWLACSSDLSKLLCAIYFGGHPGAGKTLFAQGVARQWSDTPGELDLVLGGFNDEIVRCPLILADETLPKTWKGTSITAKLRSILSTLERALTRKYLPNCTLRGAIRLVITANNEFLLASKDSMTGQDAEAIAQRFIHIDAPEEATKYLESLPMEVRDSWAKGELACHALWLAANRKVTPGKRFWVEGEISRMHRMLIVSNEWTTHVVEALCRFLENPVPYERKNDGRVRVDSGRLLVNEQGLVDGWSILLPHKKQLEPDTGKIGTAMRAISEKDRPHLRWGNERYRYRVVKTDIILAWAEENNFPVPKMRRTLMGVVAGERVPGMDDLSDEEIESQTQPAIGAKEPF